MFTTLETKVDEIGANQARLETKVDKLELRMENEVIEKIRALYDSREVQSEINEQIITTLGRIEAKVDVFQTESLNVHRG